MHRPAHVDSSEAEPEAAFDAGFGLVVLLAGACLLLGIVVVLRGLVPGGSPGAQGTGGSASPSAVGSPAPTPDVASFLYPSVRDAAPIALTDPTGARVTLASMRGGLVLVFFGYTHCPDVCPTTIGSVGTAMRDFGPGVRAVFVTIDPERDTPTWLAEFVRYMPAGFTALTGTAGEIRSTADAWGVRYARVETGIPGGYSMSHTADVFIVDGDGRLRGHFPFGTSPAAMTATLRALAAPPSIAPSVPPTGAASATPAPSPTVSPPAPAVGGLRVMVVSSAVWAGGPSPVILALYGPAGRLADLSIRPSVQLTTMDGSVVGSSVEAVPVQPPGVDAVSYVATVNAPKPGWWRLAVSATPGALTLAGTADFPVLDQGASAPIGSAAPTIHTPTLDDVAGDARQLTTDPIPDLRLYRRSTTDALADHAPFVLVLDSTKFRVTTFCGKALVMARYLQDRWPDITFIHHEPYRYSVVTDTPVLEGSLAAPHLTDVADAWGIGGDPWGPLSMPWVFVVDGNGVVRAKYQGIMGSDDVDVIVALIAEGG